MIIKPVRLWHPVGSSLRSGLAVFVLAMTVAGRARAEDTYLPALGGGGGGFFSARCAEGELLAGVELRTGDDVDAIRPLCVTAYGPREITAARPTTGWYGGTGGGLRNLLCPPYEPILDGIIVGAESGDMVLVNDILLYCGVAATRQGSYDGQAGNFIGPVKHAPTRRTMQRCPSGLVAVGIHGRSGIFLDAMGLICNEPRLSPKPVRPQGRVRYQEPVKPQGRVRLSIDLSALHARGAAIANEDPVIAELRSRQTDGPIRRGFDIGIAAAEGQTEPGPGKQRVRDLLSPTEQGGFDTALAFSLPRNKQRIAESAPERGQDPPPTEPPICANARQARARNSPAAPGLEAQCRAAGGNP